jgi:uncharacterized protein
MIAGTVPSSLYEDQRSKTFTIPPDLSVVLYGPEIDVIGTPEFQRLDRIKQLATAYLAYRGAKHTRFEHSLGTLHRADQMVRAINENPHRRAAVDDRGWRLARLTALLHDLPHVPFGHTLEDEFGLLERHDSNRLRWRHLLAEGQLGQILEASLVKLSGSYEHEDSEWRELLEILDPDIPTISLRRPYIRDIIGNTVCADALDYVPRDLAACGMPGKLGTRFLDFLTIMPESAPEQHRWRTALSLEKRGMPRPDVESEVVKLLSYRYELAERVYFHHAKNAASVMLGRAIVDCGLIPPGGSSECDEPDAYDRKFWRLSDELLLTVIEHPDVAAALNISLDPRVPEEAALATELARRIVDRDLYKIAFLASRDDVRHSVERIWSDYGSATKRRALEDTIADRCGVPRGHVLLHLPKPSGLAKLADVRVLADHDEIVSLEQWDQEHSKRLEAINVAHARLWRVTVYVHPEVSEHAASLVRAYSTDIFGAPSRYGLIAAQSVYTQELFKQNAKANSWTVEDSAALTDVRALQFGTTMTEVLEEMQAVINAYRSRAPKD